MQDYNTIIGAIQMRLNKCPTRSVMDRFRIGSSTLNLIMSRYKALELTIDELGAMSPKKVENLFYPQKNLQRKEVPLPDFQYYYDRIHAPNSRVNISFCWLDYKEKNPDGYEKSQFYEYYQRFVQENYGGTKISMAVNRKPGEKMYIDWVGDQPGLLTDVTTGEIMRVHIFATTLGVSSIIYAEAFPNEKRVSILDASGGITYPLRTNSFLDGDECRYPASPRSSATTDIVFLMNVYFCLFNAIACLQHSSRVLLLYFLVKFRMPRHMR